MTPSLRGARLGALALLLALAAGCGDAPSGPAAPEPPAVAPDRALFREAAQAAWAYMEREYHPATGLVNSVAGYEYATMWDVASGLAALYGAGELGLVGAEEYDRRMRRVLLTLRTLPLSGGVAFNKNYSTATAEMAGRDDREAAASERGIGWSVTDAGRLLVWLKIVATAQPRYAEEIQAIVKRLDFPRMVEGGYLQGASIDAQGRLRTYPEGRIGYEQYAAAGFAAWGVRAERALRLHENSLPISVMGVPLIADRRGHDYLTSEPFVLAGLELGWDAEMRELAINLLAVQRERWRRTGQVTIVSEDHVPAAPHYFYYYAVNHHGSQFTIGSLEAGEVPDGPRWVSAKAAFAWHALLPGEYTRTALAAVAPARDPLRGWGSGVYEATGKPTGSENVNTAAVILTAALYATRGGPLLD